MKTMLVTNDDGFESVGLKALVDTLREVARVIVVAPTTEKSACSHSLTLTRPLRFVKLDDDFYKLDDGTPTDCVYLAINALFEEGKPDLVVSGINKGANMGEDITYSGTAAGAMEGAIHDIPSVAISQVCNGRCQGIELFDFALAKESIKKIVQDILDGKLQIPHRRFLNVNIPHIEKEKSKGFKITNAGYRLYGNDAHVHRNPRGDEYHWIGLHPLAWGKNREGMSDFKAVSEGYVSITPVKLDLTSYEDIKELQSWIG
ncbi:MAG: 5'/3'-nucleotidase SurE [Campylobacterales bacterium]